MPGDRRAVCAARVRRLGRVPGRVPGRLVPPGRIGSGPVTTRTVTRTALLSDRELCSRVDAAMDTFALCATKPFEHRDAAAGWAAWQELLLRRAVEREAVSQAKGKEG